jgi:hypothetical protein
MKQIHTFYILSDIENVFDILLLLEFYEEAYI